MNAVDFRNLTPRIGAEPRPVMTFTSELQAQDFTAWLNVDSNGCPTELSASCETSEMLDDGNLWTVSALVRGDHHCHMLWVTFYNERRAA
jgi:hypothetical protein